MKSRTIVLSLIAGVPVFVACYFYSYFSTSRFVQLSEKPAAYANAFTLQALPSTLGLQVQIPYVALRSALELATENPYKGRGNKQTCQEILFKNVCATALWEFEITRSGAVTAERYKESVRLAIPFKLIGVVGLAGKSAEFLGLTDKQIVADLLLVTDITLHMRPDWCPTLSSHLTYRWRHEPHIRLAGNIRLNLRKAADRALEKQLPNLEKRLSDIIDCSKFRHRLAQQWRVHHIPLQLADHPMSYLAIKPESAYISDGYPSEHALQISLEVNVTTELVKKPEPDVILELPALSSMNNNAGVVEFSALLKLPYQTINELLAAQLVNSQQSDQDFIITSVEVYPSGDKLTFALGFSWTAASRFITTQGEVYISGKPLADPHNNLLKFSSLDYTRIIDNELFEVIAALLHEPILKKIQKEAIFDLNDKINRLEASFTEALADQSNTASMQILARNTDINLIAINPESDGLAIIVHLSTVLTGTVPAHVLLR